ncbi:MAG TPA: alkaline phosphatase family protein, partial [Candidatus Polarisedimenticolia bacterium]|nr:alkaline phosphatase family protein [Candidatus Polarisedimenticolia bacterium]
AGLLGAWYYARIGGTRTHPAADETGDASSGRAGGGAPVPPSARGGRRVLFVGLDGADWDLLAGYMADGTMPNLASLAREGRAGVLTTQHPPLSPLVWTSMMTGLGPLEHGILDFTRFDPASGARQPITSDERVAPAIWNIASAAGRTVAVFGLWATWPAEPVRGLMVSDRLFSFQYQEEKPPPGVVFPPERAEWARKTREATESAVGFEALRAYLPWLTEPEYRRLVALPDPYARPVSGLRRILIETRVYDALARAYLQEELPDLAVVYFQGTDAIGHLFAPYPPPRQEGISEADFEHYAQVPEVYFREIDRLLGVYRDLARASGAVLMIASDHGFFWREGRPKAISSLIAATAGRWHRNEGIYLLWGSGITPAEPGAVTRGAPGGVRQVCATLLALLGLPPGVGIAGPPLDGVAAGEGPPVDYRALFHPAAAPATSGAPAAPEANEEGDAEAIAKLRALGYIGSGEVTSAPHAQGAAPAGAAASAHAAGSTRTPGAWNNAGLILREAGKTGEAVAAFEQALALDPHLASALWNLSDLLAASGGDRDRSDTLLVRSLADGSPDGVRNVIGRALAYGRAGEAGRSLALLGQAVEARPTEPDLWLFRGRYRVDRGDCAGGLDDFRRAARLEARNPLIPASAGLARLCLGDRAGAAREFRRSLDLDPNQPEVRRYLEGG